MIIRATLAAALALGLLAAPLAAPAQQPSGKTARIGFLVRVSTPFDAFREGLRELGYVEGQNIVLEYRFADGRDERLPDGCASKFWVTPGEQGGDGAEAAWPGLRRVCKGEQVPGDC